MLQILSNFCADSAEIWQIIGKLINVVKIVIPIIIVLLAMFDLGKAVMAGEEKEIQAAQKMLIKRLVYGVIIFFVVTIVQVVFNLVGKGIDKSEACWVCATGISYEEELEYKSYVDNAKAEFGD